MARMVVRGGVAAGMLAAMVMAALLSAAPRASAQDYPWCGVYSSGSERCSFANEAQCMSSLGGTGGFCRMVPGTAGASAYAAAPSRRRK